MLTQQLLPSTLRGGDEIGCVGSGVHVSTGYLVGVETTMAWLLCTQLWDPRGARLTSVSSTGGRPVPCLWHRPGAAGIGESVSLRGSQWPLWHGISWVSMGGNADSHLFPYRYVDMLQHLHLVSSSFTHPTLSFCCDGSS